MVDSWLFINEKAQQNLISCTENWPFLFHKIKRFIKMLYEYRQRQQPLQSSCNGCKQSGRLGTSFNKIKPHMHFCCVAIFLFSVYLYVLSPSHTDINMCNISGPETFQISFWSRWQSTRLKKKIWRSVLRDESTLKAVNGLGERYSLIHGCYFHEEGEDGRWSQDMTSGFLSARAGEAATLRHIHADSWTGSRVLVLSKMPSDSLEQTGHPSSQTTWHGETWRM